LLEFNNLAFFLFLTWSKLGQIKLDQNDLPPYYLSFTLIYRNSHFPY
jgi:choline-glycine betaine transporter